MLKRHSLQCCRCVADPGINGITKLTDVLPQDLVKSRRHEIRI